jgi:hypothetical protein
VNERTRRALARYRWIMRDRTITAIVVVLVAATLVALTAIASAEPPASSAPAPAGNDGRAAFDLEVGALATATPNGSATGASVALDVGKYILPQTAIGVRAIVAGSYGTLDSGMRGPLVQEIVAGSALRRMGHFWFALGVGIGHLHSPTDDAAGLAYDGRLGLGWGDFTVGLEVMEISAGGTAAVSGGLSVGFRYP